MGERLNVLWLPGWFPSRVDFLVGDFIERHAKAVSEQASVTVIYVVKDVELKKKKNEIIKEQTGRLTVYRGYYAGVHNRSIFNRGKSLLRYYRLLFTIYQKVREEEKKIDLCHVHVPLKQALLAIWLKRSAKLEYVITEQNAWYMPGNNGFFSQSFIIKAIVRAAFKRASAIHVVSTSLGQALTKNGIIDKPYTVIPNVVNAEVFKPLGTGKRTNDKQINFIAVTGDTWHKNTDGIIRSFGLLAKKSEDASLHIAGPNTEELKELVKELEIQKKVFFYGAVSNEKVASIIQQSDAMLFFTRYETFGCVMAEALCCGIPVIASRLPVLEENLTDMENALFVEPGDENDLTEKLIWFEQNKKQFDAVSIAGAASAKYNYRVVALQFIDFYIRSLHKKT